MDRHQEKSVAEKLRNKVIAASITTGVGIAALTGCAPNAEAKPQETTISASPEATEAKNYDHLFAHAEDYTIPAGLNAEELGTVILDKYTEAINQSSQYDIFD